MLSEITLLLFAVCSIHNTGQHAISVYFDFSVFMCPIDSEDKIYT